MPEFIRNFIGLYAAFQTELRGKKLYDDAYRTDGCSTGPEVFIPKLNRKVISFASLGYLGLSEVPEIRKMAAENHLKYTIGSASSRTVLDTEVHCELERRLAEMKGAESCLLLNTGYSASSGVITLLINELTAGYNRLVGKPASVVYIDELTHASIKDSLSIMKRQDKVVVRQYRHLNYDMLEKLLKRNKEKDGFKFIVTDSLFSMNGSFADVKQILELAKMYEAFIILDNAHSDGCYGKKGSGVLSAAGITDPADLQYFFEAGTLSKAFSLMGGHVTLPYCISDLARISHWPYVFSVASSPAMAATAITELDYIQGSQGDLKREQLKKNTDFLLPSLQNEEFNTLHTTSHIVPVVVGQEQKTLVVQEYLINKHNIFVGAVRHPAVKTGEALLRFSITALHELHHLEQVLDALGDSRRKFNF